MPQPPSCSSYSPNLSRRCTHLALYDDSGSGSSGGPQPGACSDKLRIALRNRAKWGLHIVQLQWLLQSAQAEARLDEAAFPLHVPQALVPADQEQAAPNTSAAGRRPLASKGSAASIATSSRTSSMAAETFQGPGGSRQAQEQQWNPSAAAGAAGHMQHPADPLRQSVNSRPLSSFRPPVSSLHTQSPSIKRSVRWQHPAAEGVMSVSQCSTARRAAGSGAGTAAAAAAHAATAAGVLPAEVEHLAQQEEEDGERAL